MKRFFFYFILFFHLPSHNKASIVKIIYINDAKLGQRDKWISQLLKLVRFNLQLEKKRHEIYGEEKFYFLRKQIKLKNFL